MTCRLQHLVSQLKWRLSEGLGECFYELGIRDSGILSGLPKEDLEASIGTLRLMASHLGAHVSVIRRRELEGALFVAECLVRRDAGELEHLLEIRVGIIGGADAGSIHCHLFIYSDLTLFG